MIKHGVKLAKQNVWAVAMPIIFEIYRDFGVTAVITSGTDGLHLPNSLHYSGMAFDFRTRHVPLGQREELAAEVSRALGDNFDVVLESDHLHVEYDP